MIAVCPTCHDAIHHGQLAVDDRTLYRWKTLTRTEEARSGHVYVEPAREAKLVLGSVAVTGDAGLVVFELSEGNRLGFALKDSEIVLLSLVVTNRRREEVVRLVDGYVRVPPGNDVEYRSTPGHHLITVPRNGRFVPKWAIEQIRLSEPGYASDERITLLDLEVLEPGLVRVQGVWMETLQGTIITAGGLYFVLTEPRVMRIGFPGAGPDTVLHYTGPITTALFGFGGDAAIDVTGQRGATVRPPWLPR